MSFINALTNTLAIEGGYANDPNDTGGETYRGISRVHHPKWPGWKIIDACKHSGIPLVSRELLTSMVNAFYHDEFWLKAGCNIVDTMSELVAEELFEASVNCGRGNGVKFLQRALNVLNVAPLTGAWIETGRGIGQELVDRCRAPHGRVD